MNRRNRIRHLSTSVMMALLLLLAGRATAQVPGWDPGWPNLAGALAGCGPQEVREFRQQSALLAKNPNDVAALVNRAVSAHRLAKTSRSDMYLDLLAAKDLERAIKLNPRDWEAWHNYGDLNYAQGDAWMVNSHANAQRAVDAFSHAIAINPRSARTYLGRGWAYYQMYDPGHAKADFQKALELDPSLRADMQTEINNIDDRHRQEDAARGVVRRMGSYWVEKTATTQEQCKKIICFWTQNECRCSNAMNPGK